MEILRRGERKERRGGGELENELRRGVAAIEARSETKEIRKESRGRRKEKGEGLVAL